jgi:anti-sigma factor (TIGR02949 family)
MKPISRYTCEDTFRRLEDYVDRELSPEEMARVERHLETCADCTAEYAFQASMLHELRARIRRIEIPAGLFERVSTRLASALVAGDEGAEPTFDAGA